MTRKDIQAIIIPKHKLQLRREITKRARTDPITHRRRTPHKPGPGRDRHKPRNRTRTKPNRTPLPLKSPIPQHPRQPADTRRKVRDDTRLHRPQVRTQRAPAVKPKPSKPQENRAQHDVGRVMRFIRKPLRPVAPPFAEVDGDREGSGSRGDMHGGTAGEVEPAEDEGPAVGVPCPACDGVVDECGPEEDEDKDRPDAGVFGERADGEHGSVVSVARTKEREQGHESERKKRSRTNAERKRSSQLDWKE